MGEGENGGIIGMEARDMWYRCCVARGNRREKGLHALAFRADPYTPRDQPQFSILEAVPSYFTGKLEIGRRIFWRDVRCELYWADFRVMAIDNPKPSDLMNAKMKATHLSRNESQISRRKRRSKFA